jgi:regulator of protease activity HflC (stomatin/prohibitin superfamily)
MKPWIFGHGGVYPEPVKTGREYGAPSSQAVDVDMLPQRVDMEFDDMMTASGVPVAFHVVVTFKVIDSVALVSRFGADRERDGWGFWSRIIDQPMRTAVRDAVKKREMQEMAISQTAADEVGREVKAAALEIVKTSGVPIQISDLNVGRVNPPDAIKNQRIATAEQEQRAITEQQRKLAEDQRKAAEMSRAAADNAYRMAMQLSPEQYLRLETIKMQLEVCGSAGKGTCTFIIGAGPVPTMNLGK